MSKYQDIINYPHYELKNHGKMTRENRASQFASFAALTGYFESISEIDRFTKEKKDITEDEKYLLDLKIQLILENTTDNTEVNITYFIPDKTKSGGCYQTISGIIKKVDIINKKIILEDTTIINTTDIIEIKSSIIPF